MEHGTHTTESPDAAPPYPEVVGSLPAQPPQGKCEDLIPELQTNFGLAARPQLRV